MIYLILLILGLLVGGVFLVVLLIGDKKEARLEAQRKALQEQIAQAGQPQEGAWPPPPSASALPDLSQPIASAKPAFAPGRNRQMVRTFFLIRNYAAGTGILAYIIYCCFSQVNFGWILLTTALAAFAVWVVSIKLKRSRQSANRLLK